MSVPRISKEELKQRLDSGRPPVLVDARLKYPYEHSTLKLPGAIRFRHSSRLAGFCAVEKSAIAAPGTSPSGKKVRRPADFCIVCSCQIA